MLACGSDASQPSRIFVGSTAPVKLGNCQPGGRFTAPCQLIVEDPVFGFRAALLSNVTYKSGKSAQGDGVAMKLL
jgi:hypothetical protein